MMTMMVMEVMVPPAATDCRRLEIETGDAGRNVETGLALNADRLQRISIGRSTDQEVAAATDADRGVGANAAVATGQRTITDRADRRVHRPGELGALGDAEIEAEAANGGEIGLGPAAFSLEHALQIGDRTHHKGDILAALALQHASADRRHCIGACDRRQQRDDSNGKGRNSHGCGLRLQGEIAGGQEGSVVSKTRRFPKSTPKQQMFGRLCDLTTADYRRSVECVCMLLRGPRSWSRRRSGMPVRARTPSPAPPRRLRS